MTMTKEWTLEWRLRLAILCLVAGYLLFTRPWAQSNPAIAMDHISVSSALLTLAVLRQRTRLWAACGLALGAAFLVIAGAEVARLMH